MSNYRQSLLASVAVVPLPDPDRPLVRWSLSPAPRHAMADTSSAALPLPEWFGPARAAFLALTCSIALLLAPPLPAPAVALVADCSAKVEPIWPQAVLLDPLRQALPGALPDGE